MTVDLRGVRAAVLTLSDSIARGEHADTSGDLIAEVLTRCGAEVVARDLLPDDQERIAARLKSYADHLGIDVVLTSGGSGLAPRDVTPEATLQVIDRLAPGLVEAARAQTLSSSPLSMLSRAVAGVRRRTLIINLPGSPKGAQEWLEIILPALGHAIDLLRGTPPKWGEPHDQDGTRDQEPGTG